MGGLKTFALSSAITLASLFPQTAAANEPLDPLATFFARCTGQLSALMEFQWLTDGPASEETAHQRKTMEELLFAVMPVDAGRDLLHIRISAKSAFSGLLTRAYFNEDAQDAVWALEMAERHIANCRGQLLN